MSKVTHTINPLHFEDLEPHRFEDLVRQLAYRFRPWRQLEAVGRLGRDDGMDIRGIEVVDGGSISEPNEAFDGGEETEEATGRVPIEEREWRIQCKRYKEIGPKLIREIVYETVPDLHAIPYGVIVAAACDVSAESMAVFREETLARGVTEGHLWTRAHLEDMLFLPDNDHLLFAYFGVSLGLQRQNRFRRIRDAINTKRKVMQALKVSSASERPVEPDVVIHDIADEHYPYMQMVPGYAEMELPPWFVAEIDEIHPRGLLVIRKEHLGWVKADETWDILPDSGEVRGVMGIHYEDSIRRQVGRRDKSSIWALWNKAPDQERTRVLEVRFIPYRRILEVDPVGDPWLAGPHLYCQFAEEAGPFTRQVIYWKGRGMDRTPLTEENRRPLFNGLQEEVNGEPI